MAGIGQEISGQIYVISSNKAITLDRYFEVAKDLLNSKSPVEYLTVDEIIERRSKNVSKEGMEFLVEHMCFDLSKAREDIGYNPEVSTEQGLVNSLEWCIEEGIL